MTTALYAGSFDPITSGHINIIEKASKVFDKIIVGVSKNSSKKDFVPIAERVELVKEAVKHINNVEVVSYSGLTADYMKNNNIKISIRGLRDSSDFDYEARMNFTNKCINKDIETVFFVSDREYSHISSTFVREIFLNKGDISSMVPEVVNKYLLSLES